MRIECVCCRWRWLAPAKTRALSSRHSARQIAFCSLWWTSRFVRHSLQQNGHLLRPALRCTCTRKRSVVLRTDCHSFACDTRRNVNLQCCSPEIALSIVSCPTRLWMSLSGTRFGMLQTLSGKSSRDFIGTRRRTPFRSPSATSTLSTALSTWVGYGYFLSKTQCHILI